MVEKVAFFVTGTDTDAGKTVVSCGLLEKAKQQGLSTLAMKPIASGCDRTEAGLINSDAKRLLSVMSEKLPYNVVNPLAFEPAIAPHIAASEQNKLVSIESLAVSCKALLQHPSNFFLMEGAGGWRVPLCYDGSVCLSHLPKLLSLPVILVVGVKLGCINHARLTVEAISNDGLQIAGWVANQIDPDMERFDENVKTLLSVLPDKCLGCIPYLSNPEPKEMASYLSLDFLLS